MKSITLTTLLSFLLLSCAGNESEFDATGTFEAVETIISANANGTIREFKVEEGQVLRAGETVGYIDTTQLYLKKKQLEAQIRTVLSKKPQIAVEIASLQEQLQQAKRNQARIANLVTADAATQKQLDDATFEVDIIRKKISAQQISLGNTSSSLGQEAQSLLAQVAQINDQLAKSRIVNEKRGSVIVKYAEQGEIASTGKPLYKIADLSYVTLRAYITGDQFAQIKLGQKVKVFTDADAEGYKQADGIIEWISDKAEFTPKTIQTKDERANLVYAIKVRVRNDGWLKIGMYGEVKFK